MGSDGTVFRLTKTAVEKIPRPAPGGRSVVWDVEVKGFGVRVAASGTRTYVLRYRMGGRATPLRTFTIGQHGSPWTVDQARRRALDLLAQVRSGVDPAAERAAERGAVARDDAGRAERMFAAVADRWFDQHVRGGGLRSLKDVEGVLERDLKPAFAGMTVDEIDKGAVARLVETVGGRSHDAANKAFKWLRQMTNWMVAMGVIAVTPLAGMRMPYKEGRRTRALSLLELVIVWEAVATLPEPFRDLYRLLILLGQRLCEVANAPWSEFDMTSGDWLIPGARTKNGRDHVVPLPDQALAIVTRIKPDPKARTGPILTTDGKVGISGFSKLKARVDELVHALVTKTGQIPGGVGLHLEEWVVHDLRRSLTTNCQALGIQLPVTEAILNHVSGSKAGIAGVYHLYDFYDEKADALQRWADLVDAAVARWRSGDLVGVLALDPARRSRRTRLREDRPSSVL